MAGNSPQDGVKDAPPHEAVVAMKVIPPVTWSVTEISGMLLALTLAALGLRMLLRRSLCGSGWFLVFALVLPVNALFGIALGMVQAFGGIIDDESANSAVLAAGIASVLEGHLWMLGISLMTVPLAIWVFVRNRRRQRANAKNAENKDVMSQNAEA